MNFWWKFGIIVASYVLAGTIGWHTHTWYEGYKKAHDEKVMIDERVAAEKSSNDDAAKTAKKEAEDAKKARVSNAAVEKHIEDNGTGYKCPVPVIGVRDLQQAVAAHTGTRKPH